jgi:transcriptional regulator
MYLPKTFDRSADIDTALSIMREYPFASLITTDASGLPFVSHIPLHVEARGQALVLHGHVAKPNPQWEHLKANERALVTFMGPHAYMSPSVYPDLARVPTWNYLAVHCAVRASLLDGDAAKDALLKHLINDHEPAYADQWRGLDGDFQSRLMNGIVAFELTVEKLECKVKINQHRPESHAKMLAQYSAGSADEQALAKSMQRLFHS